MDFTLRFCLGAALLLLFGTSTHQTHSNATSTHQNNTIGKLQKSEPYTNEENGRAIDVDKYVSEEFHGKNSVYTLPISPDTEKYVDPSSEYNYQHTTTIKEHEDFDFESDLTTPKSLYFDQKYQQAVDSFHQKLEYIDEDENEENIENNSEEELDLNNNNTKTTLNYINYKNIETNDNKSKNSLHQDLLLEQGTNLNFESSYNQTILDEEEKDGNNTITKENKETTTTPIPTKVPKTTQNPILTNKIEPEKGEKEVVPEVYTKKTTIEITKRGSVKYADYTTTETPNNNKNKTEQLVQENQIVAVKIQPPIIEQTTKAPLEPETTVSFETTTETVETTTETIQSTTLEQETTTVAVETTTVALDTTTLETTSEAITTTTEVPELTSTIVIDTTTEFKEETTTVPVEEENKVTITTENSMRTSKGMLFPKMLTTEENQISTTDWVTTEVIPTTTPFQETTIVAVIDDNNNIETKTTEINITTKVEEDTETNTIISTSSPDSGELNNNGDPESNGGTIAAIVISTIGAICLIILAGLLLIMRKRQKRFNYGQRCTPVSLDDYSMDNISVYNNSVRRKGAVRSSKRSYGNPAFEDPSSVSHPLNFPALGKFSNNIEDMLAEYEEIPQITARTNELPEGCDTKNRYANVIPLPETRVFLSAIDGIPNSDYINANFVTGPKNVKGYYIACQAPLQNTLDDFWRMIWEQQCKIVLMLTHFFENGVEKCVDYLPPSEVLDCHRVFGDFQVTLKKREVKDKYIISILQLKNMVSNSWREITHFWYMGWPEKGVPSEANSLIAFLIEARSYIKSSSLDRREVNGNLGNGVNEFSPVVVHCSPGTGRTGVVIACDIAIREFEQSRLVDVPRIVYKIRRDRASSVQTKEQYAFIYKVINLYATKLTGGALDSF